MIQNQNPPIPGITPPVGPPEAPVQPNYPEAPEPVIPGETPPMNPEPEAPPMDPNPERSPVDPGIPEINPDPLPGQQPVEPMK